MLQVTHTEIDSCVFVANHIETAFHKFGLAATGIRNFAAIPFNPLALVAVPDDRPRLVINYDHHAGARVNNDVLRIKPDCTHVNVTLLPGIGETPICAGFGAASSAVTLSDGTFSHLEPDLQDAAKEIFGALDGLSPLAKIFHPSLRTCMPGHVNDESWRICDSFMSIALEPEQIQGARDVIRAWQESPPDYEVRSIRGVNCKDFVAAVAKGADVRMPLWWRIKPWPGMDALVIKRLAGNRLKQAGDWLLQPPAVTERLGQIVRGFVAEPKRDATIGLTEHPLALFTPEYA